jgi:CRP-like cAMP-binding protein
MLRPSIDAVRSLAAILGQSQQTSNPGRDGIPFLRALFKSEKRLHLGPRSPMFREGERADYAYLLDSGVARTYRFFPNGRRIVARFLFPGDVVGLEFDDRYPFSAETIQEVYCYRVTIQDLDRLRAHSTRLRDELVWLLRDHIATRNVQIVPLMHQQAEARIARLLSTFALRNGCGMRNGTSINLPMPRGDIADFLGLTPETVCRTFTKLKNDGIIALLSPEKVQVTDARRLQALAEEED